MQTVTNGGETLTYTYDDRGLVRKVEKDANNYSEYRYNALGELIRENYKWGGTSYTMIYAYDVGGNITSKTQYAFVTGDGQVGTPIDTIAYTYDATWQDKLASYDGTNITYDSIGNPLDDGTWEYTWTQGNNLQQITDGTTTASYTYNSSGIRTSKTVNGTTTIFNLVGGNITWQKTGANTPTYFLYDSGGKLWGLKYNGSTYFYVRNLQGDIIKIVNSTGAVVVEYAYDTWGNPMNVSGSMASTLGVDNPFRYRGYYYDEETGLYYLNSRYYNSEWSRFINADTYGGSLGLLLSHNLFVYCVNNPVMYCDSSGRIVVITIIAIVVLLGLVVVSTTGCTDSESNDLMQADETYVMEMTLDVMLDSTTYLGPVVQGVRALIVVLNGIQVLEETDVGRACLCSNIVNYGNWVANGMIGPEPELFWIDGEETRSRSKRSILYDVLWSYGFRNVCC